MEITSFSLKCTEFPVLVVSICKYTITATYMYMYMYNELTGRHCCLYCSITHERMQIPMNERGCAPLRTLATLQSDHLQFQAIGKGLLKNAKHHNNVIAKFFFDIPLSQVEVSNMLLSLHV